MTPQRLGHKKDKSLQSKAKSEAWDEFSRFIRIRDCLKTTGFAFLGICITCERRFHIRYLQAGHFLPGRSNAILFDEIGTNAQCRYCNEYKHGERKKYEAVMVERHGQEYVDKMKISRKKVVKDMDFEAIKKSYKKTYKAIMREFGFKTYGELLREARNG